MTPLVVPQHLVDHYFPLVAPMLQKAMDRNNASGWTMPALYRACAMREAYLFVDSEQPKNALVGRFEEWGGIPTFYIQFMGGEGGADWPQAMKEIRKFAGVYGVTRITAHVRDGWLKHFKVRKLSTLCEFIEDQANG